MILQNGPLVSVIIPFLNENRFIKEAVESVLQQTYTNWELLLIDDGSTDESSEIAKGYATSSNNKIKYFEHNNHENFGISTSRNLGIKNSLGKLIAFLDADDIWLPEKLSNQILIFEQYPEIGMVIEASNYWHDWGKNSKNKNSIMLVGAQQNMVHYPPQLLLELYPLGKGNAPCPSSFLIKKQAIEDCGSFEETFLTMYEDQAFLCKIYLNEKIYVSSLSNNYYRIRNDSVSQIKHSRINYHKIRKNFLEWFKIYLSKNQVNNDDVNKLLEKNLYPYQNRLLSILLSIKINILSALEKIFKISNQRL